MTRNRLKKLHEYSESENKIIDGTIHLVCDMQEHLEKKIEAKTEEILELNEKVESLERSVKELVDKKKN